MWLLNIYVYIIRTLERSGKGGRERGEEREIDSCVPGYHD